MWLLLQIINWSAYRYSTITSPSFWLASHLTLLLSLFVLLLLDDISELEGDLTEFIRLQLLFAL